MSASPADRTPGRTPNGTVPPPRRRAPVNPLVQPKKRPPRPGQNRAAPAKAGKDGPPARAGGGPKYRQVPQLELNQTQTIGLQIEADLKPSGFSSEAVDTKVQDFPLVLTKGALKEGFRHHVLKFFTQKTIDPRNENEFTRPVRLQRRDARAMPPGAKDGDPDVQAVDPEERQKKDLERQERQAKREIELSQIAPSANPTAPKKPSNKQKKIQEVLRHDQTEEQKAATQLRYEEALQWHLEDFDNKHNWVGGYESALSHSYAQLLFQDGKFHMVPLEKWYKFIPKNLNLKQMQLEEAEQKMEGTKAKSEPGWLVERKFEEKRRIKEEEQNKRASSRLWVGSALAEHKNKAAASQVKEEIFDRDDLDFVEDFADDEGPDMWEGGEDDVKENEERIKKDQLQANVFDMKDEKTYDQADKLEKRAKLAEKEHGKRVKKALMKRERNRIYESDSENPFDSGSDSTDTEAEREKEEQAKKEAEEKANGSQAASGTSSKNATPSNRSSKHPERQGVKRSGSANASDLSGNESSRKKQKKAHSRLGTGANTPNGATPLSRSPIGAGATANMSDGGGSKKPSIRTMQSTDNVKRVRVGNAASGSDGEGAASGGEMSDGTRKKIRMLVKKPAASTNASPGGSRSPSPGRATPRDGAAKRALSPDSAASAPKPIPTEAQLRAAIPAEGITIIDLTKKFGRGSILGPNKAEAMKRIKLVSYLDAETKKLFPKNATAAGSGTAKAA